MSEATHVPLSVLSTSNFPTFESSKMELKGYDKVSQHVLRIPELVGLILGWLAVNDPSTLAKAMRVNRLWFYEGARHLWLEWPAKKWNPLQLIKSLNNMSDNHQEIENYRATNYVLLGLAFSKLEYLDIFLEHRRQRFFLPRIQAPALKVIRIRIAKYFRPAGPDEIDFVCTKFPPWSFYPRLQQGAAVTLAKHIKLRLSHVQKLVFGHEVKVDRRLLEMFKKSLPHVEISEQSRGGPSFGSLQNETLN